MKAVEAIKDPKMIENLKRYFRHHNLRDYCLFVLGINSGLRVSDLLALTVGDVIDGKKPVDRIVLTERKTKKNKQFPLSDNAKESITTYLKTRPNAAPDEPLFKSRVRSKTRGYFLSSVQAYRILNDAAKEVGVRGRFGTHSLRKTFGFQMYSRGVDITRIQAMLNHSAPNITLRYIGITQQELDDLYLALNL